METVARTVAPTEMGWVDTKITKLVEQAGSIRELGLVVERLIDGAVVANVEHKKVHSKCLECGYVGSGPADLALSALNALFPPLDGKAAVADEQAAAQAAAEQGAQPGVQPEEKPRRGPACGETPASAAVLGAGLGGGVGEGLGRWVVPGVGPGTPGRVPPEGGAPGRKSGGGSGIELAAADGRDGLRETIRLGWDQVEVSVLAWELHHAFEAEFISTMDEMGGCVETRAIVEWVGAQLAKRAEQATRRA